MYLRNNTTFQWVVGFALLGATPVLAQSRPSAIPDVSALETIWEADAPMAAALTCFPSSAPKMQRQFDPITGDRTGPPEPKNRVLAITAGDAGQEQGVRVTWDAQPNWSDGHAALVGQRKWMTEPFQVCENSGQGLGIEPPNCAGAPGMPQKWFWAARLTCDPLLAFYGDLTSLADYCTGSGEACTVDDDCAEGTCGVDDAIHIFDLGIVPSKNKNQQAICSVQVVVIGAQPIEDCYSDALVVTQPLWGDIGEGAAACPKLPPDGQVGIIPDVILSLQKFTNAFCAPKKTRADLQPAMLDFQIGAADFLFVLNAFTGIDYPLAAGPACAAGN